MSRVVYVVAVTRGGQVFIHSGMAESESRFEVIGVAFESARRVYPSNQGFVIQSIHVIPVNGSAPVWKHGDLIP